LNGFSFVLPFLGSTKILLRTRLLVLKLFVKEFGFIGSGGGGGLLKKTMVMAIAIGPFVSKKYGGVADSNSGGEELDQKTIHAAMSLLCATSTALGKQYVINYLNIKKDTFEDDMFLSMLIYTVENNDAKSRKSKNTNGDESDDDD